MSERYRLVPDNPYSIAILRFAYGSLERAKQAMDADDRKAAQYKRAISDAADQSGGQR